MVAWGICWFRVSELFVAVSSWNCSYKESIAYIDVHLFVIIYSIKDIPLICVHWYLWSLWMKCLYLVFYFTWKHMIIAMIIPFSLACTQALSMYAAPICFLISPLASYQTGPIMPFCLWLIVWVGGKRSGLISTSAILSKISLVI